MTIQKNPASAAPTSSTNSSSWLSGVLPGIMGSTAMGKISEAGFGLLGPDAFFGSSISPRSPRLGDQTLQTDLEQRDVKKIVHLGQAHWHAAIANNLEVKEQIWKSQKAIAVYLIANPNAEIFVEGIDSTLTQNTTHPVEAAHLYFTKAKEKALQLFPTGLPSNLNSFNQQQKDFFIRHGAARTLYFLGKITTLHRDCPLDKSTMISTQVHDEYARGNCNHSDDRLRHLIYDQREEALVEEIETFSSAAENKDQKIIFIFGNNHKFAKYFDSNKFEYIDMGYESLAFRILKFIGI